MKIKHEGRFFPHFKLDFTHQSNGVDKKASSHISYMIGVCSVMAWLDHAMHT